MRFLTTNIILAIFFNILTNVGFKYASIFEKEKSKSLIIFLVSLFFGFLNSYYFTAALKDVPLNIASATFFALTIVGLFICSFLIFKEETNAVNIAGAFVIIAGVVMINR